MKEINCNIIGDLLPLRAENMVSEDTRMMVDEHLLTCETCRQALDALRRPAPLPQDDGAALKRLNKRMTLQRIRWGIAVCLLALMMTLLGAVHLNAPITLSAEDAIIAIRPRTEDGKPYFEIILSHHVTGIDYSCDHEGALFITAWDTALHRLRGGRTGEITLLSAEFYPDLPVQRVYYYSSANPQRMDVMIYEAPDAAPVEEVHGATLPRLMLDYYLAIALALTALCALLTLALRIARRRKSARLMGHIALAPLCYSVCSFLVLSGADDVYNTLYYLTAILMLSILMYIAVRFVMILFRREE